MKRHFCDICKLKEVTGTIGAIMEGKGFIDIFYIRDEFSDTPVHRRLRITIHEIAHEDIDSRTDEDICKSCLKTTLLEALKN